MKQREEDSEEVGEFEDEHVTEIPMSFAQEGSEDQAEEEQGEAEDTDYTIVAPDQVPAATAVAPKPLSNLLTSWVGVA